MYGKILILQTNSFGDTDDAMNFHHGQGLSSHPIPNIPQLTRNAFHPEHQFHYLNYWQGL